MWRKKKVKGEVRRGSALWLFLFIIAAINWLEQECSVVRKVLDGGGLHALTIKCVSALNDVEEVFLSGWTVSVLLAGFNVNLWKQ